MLTQIDAAINEAFLMGEIGLEYTNLQNYPQSDKEGTTGWYQPGNVGNTGGGSAKPHGTSIWTAGPVAAVSARPAGPYDNFYWVKDLPVPLNAPTRLVSVRQHSVSNVAGWQALEFEHQLQWAGRVYNMAWQFDIADKAVRYFDYTTSAWIATKVSMPSLADLVTVAEFSIDTLTGTVTHVALTINGMVYPIGVTQAAPAKAGPNKLTIAEQMDSTATPVTIAMTVGQCDLRLL